MLFKFSAVQNVLCDCTSPIKTSGKLSDFAELYPRFL